MGISNDGLLARRQPARPALLPPLTQLRPSSKESVNTFIRGKDVASFLNRAAVLPCAVFRGGGLCRWGGEAEGNANKATVLCAALGKKRQ